MCGIFGAVAWERPLDAEALVRATDSIRHRGPDEGGFLFDHVAVVPSLPAVQYLGAPGARPWQLGFGHRRLSILDLACGHQPMLDTTGEWAIIFNGEIYNHGELRARLLAEGAAFRTDHSDTETLLVGFARWGTAILPQLNGMFAAAIYHRTSGRLWLIRDRFGKKPLYFQHQGGTLVFGSELKALVSFLGRTPSLNWDALGDFMMRGCIHEPRTIFEGVVKLPAASYAKFDLSANGGRLVNQQRFWEFRPPEDIDDRRSDEDWAAELEHLLDDAVRIRLLSDVPVGAFLSSGIDSAVVCALASRHVSGPLHAFTIGNDDPSVDESKAASLVASHLRLRHTVENASIDPATLLTDMVTIFDEPFSDLSMVPTQQVARITAKHVKVVLTGDGADEFFGGYGVFGFMSTRSTWEKVPLLSPLMLGLKSQLPFAARGHAFIAKRFGGHGLSRYRRTVEAPSMLQLLDRAAAKKIDPAWPRIEELWRRSESYDLLTRTSLLQAMTYLTDDILVKVDRATMAYSLEARSPFLDFRVAEFTARMPARLKWADGRGKPLLRKLAQRWFSPAYLNAPKRGFTVPLKKWMQQEMSSDLDDLKTCELLDQKVVDQMINLQRRSNRDYSSPLWRVMVLNRWLKHWRPGCKS